MEIVKNDTYIVIKLLPIEIQYLGWGNLCSDCNKEITNDIYYIPILNDLMDKECMEKWYKSVPYFPEDKKYETQYINNLIYNLKGLAYSSLSFLFFVIYLIHLFEKIGELIVFLFT